MALTANPALLPKGIERDDLGVLGGLFRDFQLFLISLVKRGLIAIFVFFFGFLCSNRRPNSTDGSTKVRIAS